MTPTDRADLEALAADGCCPALYVSESMFGRIQDQCLLRPHDDRTAHQGTHYVWTGPARLTRRVA